MLGNTGKTPTSKVGGDIVSELLALNQKPTFIYGKGHPRSYLREITILPNQQVHLLAQVLKYNAG
jgi:hypothetical protein